MRSKDEVDRLLKGLNPKEMADMLVLLDELDERKRVSLAQNDFLAFIAAVDPTYKFGAHLKRLGNLLMGVEIGSHDRIAVSMAPRFGKSQMISIYYPAWYLGKHPDHKIIVASHTADLAVDMARKVRNLMQTAEYQKIFPGVKISSDAKAAGKWTTTSGGEVFAVGTGGALAGRGAHLCLDLFAQVRTRERGLVAAFSVEVGEHLQSWHGWAEVQAQIWAEHSATVTLAGRLKVSKDHPIWTLNRGWVPAGAVEPFDVLWTPTLFDTIKAHLQGALYGKTHARAVSHSDVQHLGADATAVHQPQSSQLHLLRRGWSNGMRAVAQLRELLCGYGAPTVAEAHAGSGRQQQRVRPGELPLGRCGDAAEQPHQRGKDNGLRGNAVCSSVGSQDGAHKGHDRTPGVHASDVPGGSPTSATHESQQAAYTTVPTGWLRRAGFWLLSRCSKGAWHTRLREGQERALDGAQAWQWASRVFELLLGVRYAGSVTVEEHDPRSFVNFMVSGDHTFVGDNILSHNCIIDDPLSEQDIKSGNTDSLDTTYEWFRAGLRTRLMPGGKICILHTRWHQRDLIGRLIKDGALNDGGDQYEVFEFPAILSEHDQEAMKSLWPEQWPLESLLRTKASMPAWQWNAQYQQNPTAQEAAIIKRDWINWWPHEDPPTCDFIVQSWDTALTTKARSDYSVCQTWGVFNNEEDADKPQVILLNRIKGKWEFPDLKQVAHEQFEYWQPDSVIIEAKASGQPLIDEMRRSGIFVQDFSPGKGQDKLARLNAVSDMFASGCVWVPETKWATEVVEEWLAFPSSEHDDEVDTMTLALARIRKGGLIRLDSDRAGDDRVYQRRKGYY